jgi:DNA-binding NarL/FixJ family response regulator
VCHPPFGGCAHIFWGIALKILIADDHSLVREGLRTVLAQLEPDYEVITAASLPDAVDKIKLKGGVDLALLDLNMPGMEGTRSIATFCVQFPLLPVIILSGSESLADVNGSLANGAMGYIPKAEPPAIMLSAIKLVLNGGVYIPQLKGQEALSRAARQVKFTSRQMEVLEGLARGEPNKTIARSLDISEGTVKTHVDAIMSNLNARNRTHAVVLAQQMGLINAA